MLTQIKKIKNLGVFDNYAAPADHPAFGRYNVVYGENGSGKTTLSRLLACLEAGEHADHPALEYVVESQSGSLTHGTKYARRVRVFNSDYVEANIGRFDGPLRHILIVGEENKAVAEELKAEIVTRDARKARIETITSAVAKVESDKGKLFSQVAKTIIEVVSLHLGHVIVAAPPLPDLRVRAYSERGERRRGVDGPLADAPHLRRSGAVRGRTDQDALRGGPGCGPRTWTGWRPSPVTRRDETQRRTCPRGRWSAFNGGGGATNRRGAKHALSKPPRWPVGSSARLSGHETKQPLAVGLPLREVVRQLQVRLRSGTVEFI